MKTNILLAILAILCVALLSCSKNEQPEEFVPYGPPVYKTSYIEHLTKVSVIGMQIYADAYFIDEENKIVSFGGYQGDKPVYSDRISLHIGLGAIAGSFEMYDDCVRDTPNPDERCIERTNKFYEIVREIGDTTFNRKVRYSLEHLGICAIDKIKSVSVTSDKDFNAEYPAGANLNELFTFYANDAYALIKNNYQQPEDTYSYGTNKWTANIPMAIIKKKLSTVNFPEHPYLDTRWYCILDEAPQKTDTYTFYVSVVLEDGTELKAEDSRGIKGLE